MLIIINGSQTVNKAAIAREIISAFNTFTVDGYVVKFIDRVVQIYNPENELVYASDSDVVSLLHNEDGSANETGVSIHTRAIAIQDNIETSIKRNHYLNIFADDQYDWGITPIINAPMDGQTPGYQYGMDHTYDDVITKYVNRTIDNSVICGSFSKRFVTKIREDLGNENVIVLNIIRNPSVTYVLNESSSENLTMTPAGPLDKGRHRRILIRTITSSILVNELPNVTTVRYEDILQNLSFTLNGITIPAPPTLHDNDGIMTDTERTTREGLSLVTSSDVDNFNSRYSNFSLERAEEDENGNLKFISIEDFILGKTPEELAALGDFINQIPAAMNQFPKNLFTELGYTPMTYSQIVTPT